MTRLPTRLVSSLLIAGLAFSPVARTLSWLTLAWMSIEGGVAIAAALIAGSTTLLGFGLDSGIEAIASVTSTVVTCRARGGR